MVHGTRTRKAQYKMYAIKEKLDFSDLKVA
jgi:hypothetical protein